MVFMHKENGGNLCRFIDRKIFTVTIFVKYKAKVMDKM